MAPEAIPPLRIKKSNNAMDPSSTNSSPAKPARPLAELSPMGFRRNSPSYNQATKKPLFNADSSPFDASPAPTDAKNSPRSFWKDRESVSPSRFLAAENATFDRNGSSARRTSLEKLQKASRVRNSNMLARENSKLGDSINQENISPSKGHHRRSQSNANIAWQSPTKAGYGLSGYDHPQKEGELSPSQNNLSQIMRLGNDSAFNPEEGTWSEGEDGSGGNTITMDTPRAAARQPKTVSFDAAPPQINEYEMITPDPSSTASGSREGSYDSNDSFDMDAHLAYGSGDDHEDSFDDSLEDADKTPVVLPEDWRFMSPEVANTNLANTFDDPFDGPLSPASRANQRQGHQHAPGDQDMLSRNDSVNSDGERRPLPPLPQSSFHAENEASTSDQNERIGSHSPDNYRRTMPSPPRPAPVSKADVLGIKASQMPLEERLRLLAMQDKDHTHIDPSLLSEEDKVRLEGFMAPNSAPTVQEAAQQQQQQQQQQQPPVISDTDPAAAAKSAHDEEKTRRPPKISRESILRRVKSRNFDDIESSPLSTPGHDESHHIDYANLDPDVPIPSRETSSNYEDTSTNNDVEIKEEEEEDAEKDLLDLYSYPELNVKAASFGNSGFGSSIIHNNLQEDKTLVQGKLNDTPDDSFVDAQDANENEQPVSSHQEHAITSEEKSSHHETDLAAKTASEKEQRMSLPEFTAFGTDNDFGLSLQSYMSRSPSSPIERQNKELDKDDKEFTAQDLFENRPVTPVEELKAPNVFSNESQEEFGTPESVIHHPVSESPTPPEEAPVEEPVVEEPPAEAPVVPGRVATVKASGGKLKTRRSNTVAELEDLRNEARYTSDEKPPPIPAEFSRKPSGESNLEHGSERLNGNSTESTESPKRRQSNRMTLDLALGETESDLTFGMDQEFDRLLEAQKVELFPLPPQARFPPETFGKQIGGAEQIAGQGYSNHFSANFPSRPQRGYLMRQNTKVVVAKRNASSESKESNDSTTLVNPGTENKLAPTPRETRSAGNSPRKPSGPVYTTEPWNGKMRRHSTRRSAISPEKPLPGNEPPMPSDAKELIKAAEEMKSAVDEPEQVEAGDRGRLFVKVMGVKGLDLPLPRNERSWFQLTLDNGLHCVTTAWLELGKTAPIGQEFELTVFDELDFSLTLQTKLERPVSQASTTSSFGSPTKSSKTSKPSALSRLLTSPKKRREMEKKQQEEEALAASQRQQEIEAQRARAEPTAWDLLHNLVGPDGSFARSVICLEDYERKALGRPYTAVVPCFNSWATEDSACSTRSKHGGVQRKPPYKIGKLEVQLVYVPKPKSISDDAMPQSMSACLKQMKEAEANSTRQHEGFLSQQGADCPHWRRRLFRLHGNHLTAYHEMTKQRRFNINLGKANTKLIDGSSSGKQVGEKNRRRSAFAADEEGYMFLPEGFRLRFADGETVDFYADTVAQKEEWVKMISEAVGKDVANDRLTWANMVLAKERADAAKQAEARSSQSPWKGKPQPRIPSRSAPTSPAKSPTKGGARPKSTIQENPPAPAEKSQRHREQVSPRRKPEQKAAPAAPGGVIGGRRGNVRSMVF